MGVSDGQAISAAITNAAFLNKNQADQMANPVSFTKTVSLAKRNESSGATLNALDSSSTLVNITGTVTTINGATAPTTYSDGAILVIRNSSSNTVTISNESASATAANRFSLPGSVAIKLLAGEATQLVYNSTTSRWNIFTGPDARVVVARASGDPASASANNPIIFPTSDFDTYSGYSTSTGQYTVVIPGYYRIYGFIGSTGAGSSLRAYVNNVASVYVGQTDSNGECAFIGLVKCSNVGDTIHLGATGTIDADSKSNICFERIPGPANA